MSTYSAAVPNNVIIVVSIAAIIDKITYTIINNAYQNQKIIIIKIRLTISSK
jgi:hypothetical protein